MEQEQRWRFPFLIQVNALFKQLTVIESVHLLQTSLSEKEFFIFVWFALYGLWYNKNNLLNKIKKKLVNVIEKKRLNNKALLKQKINYKSLCQLPADTIQNIAEFNYNNKNFALTCSDFLQPIWYAIKNNKYSQRKLNFSGVQFINLPISYEKTIKFLEIQHFQYRFDPYYLISFQNFKSLTKIYFNVVPCQLILEFCDQAQWLTSLKFIKCSCLSLLNPKFLYRGLKKLSENVQLGIDSIDLLEYLEKNVDENYFTKRYVSFHFEHKYKFNDQHVKFQPNRWKQLNELCVNLICIKRDAFQTNQRKLELYKYLSPSITLLNFQISVKLVMNIKPLIESFVRITDAKQRDSILSLVYNGKDIDIWPNLDVGIQFIFWWLYELYNISGNNICFQLRFYNFDKSFLSYLYSKVKRVFQNLNYPIVIFQSNSIDCSITFFVEKIKQYFNPTFSFKCNCCTHPPVDCKENEFWSNNNFKLFC